MVNRFSFLFWLAVVSVAVLVHCKGVTFLEEFIPEVQLAEDMVKITEYIEATGLGVPDTTRSGALYFILDEGDGDSVNVGDILFIELAEYNLDTSKVNSNIKISVPQDTIFLTTNFESTEPIVFTFSHNGWTLNNVYPVVNSDRDVISLNNNWQGYKEAISESFRRIKVGGHVLILLPSTFAYGPRFVTFPPNTVVLYQIYLLDRQ